MKKNASYKESTARWERRSLLHPQGQKIIETYTKEDQRNKRNAYIAKKPKRHGKEKKLAKLIMFTVV